MSIEIVKFNATDGINLDGILNINTNSWDDK